MAPSSGPAGALLLALCTRLASGIALTYQLLYASQLQGEMERSHASFEPCSGGQCTPDMLPLMRSLASFENAVPKECTVVPPLEDFLRPVLEVKQDKNISDAACYFNYNPWCSVAYNAKNYLGAALVFAEDYAGFDPRTYDFPGEFRTAPAVSPLGAKLCFDLGLLDFPDEYLWNFTLMDEAAKQKCSELYQEVPDAPSYSWAYFHEMTQYEGNWDAPGSANLTNLTSYQIQRHEAFKCDLGHHALGCDMIECIYNYCKLPDGRVGSGKQCRKDWLNAPLVEKIREEVYAPYMTHG